MKDQYIHVNSCGDKLYYSDKEMTILHRTDGPAEELANGNKYWYQNGKHHRTDGPAVEWANGYKAWYQNGKRHRTDGPAVEYSNGDKIWYQNDKLHRTDGPAKEYWNGDKIWYLEGKEYTEQEYLAKMNPSPCEGKIVEIDGKKYKLVSA